MKKERKLKVYSTLQTKKILNKSFYETQYKEIPMIRLSGNWLEAAGFHPLDEIIVTIEENHLKITKKKKNARL